MSEPRKLKVLSIDAWADGEEGWYWNNWYQIGETTLPDGESEADLVSRLISEGILKEGCQNHASVDDDGHNIVICDKEDGRPEIAIEYGSEKS